MKLPAFVRLSQLFFLTLLLLALSACSTTSVFKPYPLTINPQIEHVRNGQFEPPLQFLEKQTGTADKALYFVERGRIAQLAGDIDSSKTDFENAIKTIEESEQRAVISASKTGAQSASLLTNENAIPYELSAFEKVFVYHYQSLNFLWQSDLEGAGVEVRRANQIQMDELRKHEKDVEKAKADAEKEKAGYEQGMTNVMDIYQRMDAVAGKVKDSFQNAFTFFVSGVIYELTGKPNDAYIDYKKALEINPDNGYLQRDVLRLAKTLQMTDDYQTFSNRYPESSRNEQTCGETCGELIVLFEEDFVPQKSEVQIPLPTTAGLVAVAFPIYEVEWLDVTPLQINYNGSVLGESEPICFPRALAVKDLKEKAPILTSRQLLRVLAKGVMLNQAEKRAGILGSIAGSVYNMASEKADLRGWYTLPNDAQIMRTSLPEGTQNLLIRHGYAEKNVDVTIKPGGKTILRVAKTGNNLYTSSVTF